MTLPEDHPLVLLRQSQEMYEEYIRVLNVSLEDTHTLLRQGKISSYSADKKMTGLVFRIQHYNSILTDIDKQKRQLLQEI